MRRCSMRRSGLDARKNGVTFLASNVAGIRLVQTVRTLHYGADGRILACNNEEAAASRAGGRGKSCFAAKTGTGKERSRRRRSQASVGR